MSDRQKRAYVGVLQKLQIQFSQRLGGFLMGCVADIAQTLLIEFIANGFMVNPVVVVVNKDGTVEKVLEESEEDK